MFFYGKTFAQKQVESKGKRYDRDVRTRYQDGYVAGSRKTREELGAEIERLRALLNDKAYIRCKADYNRGHLSHGNYIAEKERGLALEQKPPYDPGSQPDNMGGCG